jgi:hypothetical protein
MQHITALLLFLLTPNLVAAGWPLGTRLDRQYTGYVSQPTTTAAAREGGWLPMYEGKCHEALGSPWIYNAEEPGRFNSAHPVILYFSAAGQISGIAAAIDENKDPDPDKIWLRTMQSRGYVSEEMLPGNLYTITVGLRESSSLCDARTTFSEVLGTTVLLNPMSAKASLRIPLSRQEADSLGYRRGSCFNGMGFHHFLDWKAQNGSMTWKAANLVPVVPMFNPVNGSINAIFFASAIVQQTVFPPSSNDWEPVPLPNALMCGNFCDKDECTFAGTKAWSTM